MDILTKTMTTNQEANKIQVVYMHANAALAIETYWCLITPIPGDNILCHFWSYNVIENEAHFMLDYLLYYNEFPSLFEHVKLESLLSFLPNDHPI